MEEKKKVMRPTVAQVKELKEIISGQTLELSRLHAKNVMLGEEIDRLKSRGLWARLLNK